MCLYMFFVYVVIRVPYTCSLVHIYIYAYTGTYTQRARAKKTFALLFLFVCFNVNIYLNIKFCSHVYWYVKSYMDIYMYLDVVVFICNHIINVSFNLFVHCLNSLSFVSLFTWRYMYRNRSGVWIAFTFLLVRMINNFESICQCTCIHKSHVLCADIHIYT